MDRFNLHEGTGGVLWGWGLTLNTEIDLKKGKVVYETNELISYLEFNYLLTDGIDLR